MAWKTARNNAIKDSPRLITCDYNGVDWYSDSYFAITYPIFDGYRKRKDQEVPSTKPDLAKIIDINKEYTPATQERVEPDSDGLHLRFTSTGTIAAPRLQKKYVDLFRELFPGVSVQLPVDGDGFAPVRMYHENKFVGVIMPLKG